MNDPPPYIDQEPEFFITCTECGGTWSTPQSPVGAAKAKCPLCGKWSGLPNYRDENDDG